MWYFLKKGISLHVLNLSGSFDPSMFACFTVSSVIKSHELSGLGGDKATLFLTVHIWFLECNPWHRFPLNLLSISSHRTSEVPAMHHTGKEKKKLNLSLVKWRTSFKVNFLQSEGSEWGVWKCGNVLISFLLLTFTKC